MEQPKTKPLPEEVEAVRQRIEDWRRTRVKRTRMPEELWQAAAALARTHGAWAISQALRVRHDGLQSRIDTAPESDRTPAAKFIEVGTRAGRTDRGDTTVELTRPDGTRLTVRVAGGRGFDVDALVAAFCQPRR
jgi:hypothetical protein